MQKMGNYNEENGTIPLGASGRKATVISNSPIQLYSGRNRIRVFHIYSIIHSFRIPSFKPHLH